MSRGRHSGKPETVRAIIERVSPGPYLELFGRKPIDGWVVFGDTIERGLFDLDIPDLGDGTFDVSDARRRDQETGREEP